MRVGVEVGGTFTDLVAVEGGRVVVTKVPSTPRSPDIGALDALRASGLDLKGIADLGHGSPLSVAVALPTGDAPCQPGDSCCHDHAYCCVTTAAAISGPLSLAPDVGRRASARPIAGSDVNHGSGDPLSPFHPPLSLFPLPAVNSSGGDGMRYRFKFSCGFLAADNSVWLRGR